MYQPDIEFIREMIKKLSFPRVASSDDERKAFAIVENEIKKYGLDFEYQFYEGEWRESYEAYLMCNNRRIDVTSTMDYNFMNLEWGFSESYDTHIESFLSNDKAKKAIRFYNFIEPRDICDDLNAVAFIIENCADSSQIACKQLSMEKYIPCVLISNKDRGYFRENDKIHLNIKTHITMRSFRNMIIKSKNKSVAPIIIGAHIDTFVGSPGASDDTFGVAIGIDIMRQCGNENIWMILFTGEEMGRLGSIDFVNRNIIDDGVKPKIYMNIDSGIEKGSGGIQITITPKRLADKMANLFEKEYIVGNDVFSSNDAIPFHELGIPIFWSWANSPYRAHSIDDTLDNIDQNQLCKMAENYSLALNHLFS